MVIGNIILEFFASSTYKAFYSLTEYYTSGFSEARDSKNNAIINAVLQHSRNAAELNDVCFIEKLF